MPGNGKGSSWCHCRLVTSRHATWSFLLSVGNALSTAYLLKKLSLEVKKTIFDIQTIPSPGVAVAPGLPITSMSAPWPPYPPYPYPNPVLSSTSTIGEFLNGFRQPEFPLPLPVILARQHSSIMVVSPLVPSLVDAYFHPEHLHAAGVRLILTLWGK